MPWRERLPGSVHSACCLVWRLVSLASVQGGSQSS